MGNAKERIFRFKKFCISDTISAMKLGVDAVLLGAWADVETARLILDAGCGCGILSLMCAQRNPQAYVSGVEIDKDSAAEALKNCRNSIWNERIRVVEADIFEFIRREGHRFDLIISNPPFFDSGVDNTGSRRIQSRHVGRFSPESILKIMRDYLRPNGKIAMIYPFNDHVRYLGIAHEEGLQCVRAARVVGRAGNPPKRMMAEYSPCGNDTAGIDEITIEDYPGIFNDDYKRLTSAFYLNFIS